jgi:hypothetical protein
LLCDNSNVSYRVKKGDTLARKPPCWKRGNTRRVSKLCVGTVVTSECSLNALRFREKTSSLLQPKKMCARSLDNLFQQRATRVRLLLWPLMRAISESPVTCPPPPDGPASRGQTGGRTPFRCMQSISTGNLVKGHKNKT